MWWDREIPPGKTFGQVIEEALRRVALWSPSGRGRRSIPMGAHRGRGGSESGHSAAGAHGRRRDTSGVSPNPGCRPDRLGAVRAERRIRRPHRSNRFPRRRRSCRSPPGSERRHSGWCIHRSRDRRSSRREPTRCWLGPRKQWPTRSGRPQSVCSRTSFASIPAATKRATPSAARSRRIRQLVCSPRRRPLPTGRIGSLLRTGSKRSEPSIPATPVWRN